MNNQTTQMTEQSYNGFKNYETWNVCLWINNTQSLYSIARDCNSYSEFVEFLYDCAVEHTQDGVSYKHPALDYDELNELIQEIN